MINNNILSVIVNEFIEAFFEGCSVEMKNSLVLVLFGLSLVHIWGWNYKPNVHLKFSSISNDPSIKYHLFPLENIDVDDKIVISLKAVQLGSCQDWCWFINMFNKTNSNKRNCDHLNIPIKELSGTSQDFYDIKPFHYEGELFEIFKVFISEIDMNIVSDFMGCKNIEKNDKMKKNQLLLIVYNHGENSTLNIWNTSFTLYKDMYGLLQFTNEEIDKISIEPNEPNQDHINNSMIFCRKIEILAKKTFYSKVGNKSNPNEDHPKKTYGLFIVLLITMVVLITFLMLISISHCSHFGNAFTEV